MTTASTDVPDGFDRLLRRHRRASGVSQEELAERAGVSVRAISDMERGRSRGPQQKTVDALADALGLTGDVRNEFVLAARQGRTRVPTRQLGLCELPPEPADLIGRSAELKWIEELVDRMSGSRLRSATIGVITGQPGVGKTTLSVRAGYDLARRFANRVYFLNLRGDDAQPVPSAVALERLLRTLGVAESAMPRDLDERASLFRLMVGRAPTVIVLDNAHDEAQVRPLLAGSASCLQLITSRRALSGLESAQRLEVGVLGTDAAVRMLTSAAGNEVEYDTAVQVATLCGHLPLALRIAGNRMSARRQISADTLIAMLTDHQHRLSALASGDRQVRATFEVSYQQLSHDAQQTFRRLSLLQQRDFSEELAASVSGVGRFETIMALDELMETSMLMPSEHDNRYQFHDLLRIYARERLEQEESEQERQTALDGMCQWTLTRLRSAADAVGPETCDDDALHWLDQEAESWLYALEHEAARGSHREAAGAARALHWYADMRALRSPWEHIFSIGLRCARAAGDLSDTAALLHYLSWAHWVFRGDRDSAHETQLEALAVARQAGDREIEGWVMVALSVLTRVKQQHEEAAAYAVAASEIFTEIDYAVGRHVSQVVHGLVYRAQGMFERVVSIRRQVVADLQRRISDQSPGYHSKMLAASCRGLGDDLLEMGDWSESLAAFEAAAQISLEIGARSDHALALKGQGEALLRMGRALQADAVLKEALYEIREEVDEKWAAADTLRLLGGAACEIGDLDNAQAWWRQALEVAEEIGAHPGKARLVATLREDLQRVAGTSGRS